MLGRILVYLINILMTVLYMKESKRFVKASRNVFLFQSSYLYTLLKCNSGSSYGQKYDFNSISSIDEYRKRVPISDYDSFKPYIDRISKGEDGVLVSEKVLMFELSSGSTSSSKYIPYTSSLKREFSYGIAPWIFNLYNTKKGLLKGKAYWSITPVSTKRQKTSGGIPVGFEEDSEYFGFLQRYLLNMTLVVPGEVAGINDMDVFRYVTLLFLVKEKQLSLISVWNPTFLTLLLEPLSIYFESIISDIRYGTLTPPGSLPPEVCKGLLKRLGKSEKRFRELSEVYCRWGKEWVGENESIYGEIWPNLRLISCWTDAYAALYVPDIKRLFPNVEIQGKGLISTEAFVSFPVTGNNGGVLSVNSHFFEFIEIDDKNTTGEYDKTRLAHELEAGKCYCVVVTTGGGLYRYRLFDIIKVTGYYNQCPVFTFEGKEDNICDCCGEKLNGHHVGRALKAIFEKYNIIPGFYMLAPEKDDKSNTIFYTLFIETENETVIDDCNVIAAVISDLEKSLRENFHYNYCRDLGQLGVARIFRINDSRKAAAIYTEACRSFGQREGNIKPVVLHKKTGWSKLFGGYYV